MGHRWHVAGVLLVALVTAGCAAPGGPTTLTEGFEEGFSAWEQDAELPDDPNRPGEKVAWNITVSQDEPRTGENSARFFLDGSQDDGTIWIVRPVSVEPGTSYQAELSAHAWSPTESFNHLADLVLYLGTDAPTEEASFHRGEGGQPGQAEDGSSAAIREPLNQREGWRAYGFNWTTPSDHDGRLHVAVGISVVWETEVTYHVDDLELTLTPS